MCPFMALKHTEKFVSLMAKRAAKKLISVLVAFVFVLTAAITLTSCGNGELQSIEITTAPAKTVYIAGETFDPTGMVVTAKYEGEKTKELKADEYTYLPSGKLSVSDRYITIKYVEDEVEKTVRQRITVTNDIVEATITKAPDKVEYISGQTFDPTGMELAVKYQDDKSDKLVVESASDVSFSNDPLTTGQQSVEITVGKVKVTQKITVNAGIYAEAENGVIEAKDAKIETDSEEATGGAYVGNMKAGDSLTFLFSAETDGAAEIVFRLASQYLKEDSNWTPILIGDCQLNLIMDVTVNGAPLEIGDDVILPGGGQSGGEPDQSLWFNWKDIDLGTIDLVEGLNTVTITFKEHGYEDTSQPDFKKVFAANVDSMCVMSENGNELSPVERSLETTVTDVILEESAIGVDLVVSVAVNYSGYTTAQLEELMRTRCAIAAKRTSGDYYTVLFDETNSSFECAVTGENTANVTVKANVSELDYQYGYAILFGYKEDGSLRDLDKEQIAEVTGGTVESAQAFGVSGEEGNASYTLGGKRYEVVYMPDSEETSDYWGCVGLKITPMSAVSEIALEEREGKIYYVLSGNITIDGNETGYTDAEFKSFLEEQLKNAFYFDLQNNPVMESGNWSGNWDRFLINEYSITLSEDLTSFEIAVDITALANGYYTTHMQLNIYDTGVDGWADFKPDIDSFTDSVTLNGKVYTVSYTKGGGDEAYFGCVGLNVSDATAAPSEPAA